MSIYSECSREALRKAELGMPLWAISVVDTLESHRSGAALEWVASYLDQKKDISERTRKWLEQFLVAYERQAPVDDLIELGRTAWYDGSTRDQDQTAVSRLFEAGAVYFSSNRVRYSRAVSMAIGAATSNKDGVPILESVRIALELLSEEKG